MTSANILVVDDEPDVEALVTQQFRRQIRKGDFRFLFAGDGQQALEVLEKEGSPIVDHKEKLLTIIESIR